MAARWDPIETLSIKQERDGHFRCSGVKNDGTELCGWHLQGDIVADINRVVDEMSAVTPENAIPYLDKLAKLTLCRYHPKQARIKVSEWTSVIRASPRLYHNQITPPSSPPPVLSSSNRSSLAPEAVQYPQLGLDGRTTEETLRSMKEEIDSLYDKVARLELALADKSVTASVKDSPRSSMISRMRQRKKSA